MNELTGNFSLQSYIDKNREKIDESLLSLRILKEIDKFLEYKDLCNKDLATQLGYSESYISQLMSGVKNVNISFLKKFEKSFNTKFDFKIYLQEECKYLTSFDTKETVFVNIKNHSNFHNDRRLKFSMVQNGNSLLEVEDVEFENI